MTGVVLFGALTILMWASGVVVINVIGKWTTTYR